NSSNISEVVIMDEVTKNTINNYLDYTSVTKDRINNYDIVLSDIDKNVLTIIPNNQLAAQYQIIDVSICPWLSISTNSLDHYVEILYKIALNELSNYGDEFV